MIFRCLAFAILALIGLSPAGATPARADAGAAARIESASGDPCRFFRGRAFGKGIDHYATEMLWVCDAIAERRRAAMPLSDRLLATEIALESYRRKIISAAVTDLDRRRRERDRRLGLSEAENLRIAEESGALTALDAVRLGF